MKLIDVKLFEWIREFALTKMRIRYFKNMEIAISLE